MNIIRTTETLTDVRDEVSFFVKMWKNENATEIT